MMDILSTRLQEAQRLLLHSKLMRVIGDKLPYSLLQSPHWARRRWLGLLGWPGMVGIGLLVTCSTLYFSTLKPALASLDAAHQSALSIQERVKLASNGLNQNQLSPAEQLAEFYRIFPEEKNLLPALEKIFAVAQVSGVRLDQGEYKVTRDRIGKLTRLQVTLPVRSEYPQIRKFLSGLSSEIPIVALEHLQFERQRIGDPVVEAKIILALYVVHEP